MVIFFTREIFIGISLIFLACYNDWHSFFGTHDRKRKEFANFQLACLEIIQNPTATDLDNLLNYFLWKLTNFQAETSSIYLKTFNCWHKLLVLLEKPNLCQTMTLYGIGLNIKNKLYLYFYIKHIRKLAILAGTK